MSLILNRKKYIELHSNDDDFAEAYFEHFFPRAKVHAQLIDEFHSSWISPCYSSVQYDKVEFHHLDHVEPDHLAKAYYLAMIASVSEVKCGIENLWLRG